MRYTIRTPCRLHLSLIDLNGSLGRVDGGFGFALDDPCIIVTAHDKIPGIHLDVPSELKAEVKHIIDEIVKFYKMPLPNFSMKLIEYYPSHVGLGSKTQLLMAVGRLVLKFLKKPFDHYELCKVIGRGGTSGVGYVTFRDGGFVVDGGHEFGKGKEKETFLPSSASNANPPLTLFQAKVPGNWVVLLTQLDVRSGAFDEEEINIFQKHCPIPNSDVESICRHLMFMLLPALLNEDLRRLGKGLEMIQQQGFKRIEISLVDPKVQELIKYLRELEVPCLGLSSFGPTVFSIFDSREDALQVKDAVSSKFQQLRPTFTLTRPNNRGYEFIRRKDE